MLIDFASRVLRKICAPSPVRRRSKRFGFSTRHFDYAIIQELEPRKMLSAAGIAPMANTHYAEPTVAISHHSAASSSSVGGLTPNQIETAYGFNQLSGMNGAGQTIAIVDAYNDPTIQNDLLAFDAAYGLANPPSMKVVSQTGSTTSLPSVDPSTNKSDDWEVEESLDVEWAHALAPSANIVLVEANSNNYFDLMTAVSTAANLPGVSVVSMSWGGGEFSSESAYNSVFTTPAGHQGVTFVASSGDSGVPGGFPAFSPNVVAVGGTSLTVGPSGNYVSESTWSDSGGGISQYVPQPSYQSGIVTQTTTMRAASDVSFDANPSTGVPICDSFSYGTNTPWVQIGGTSLSAPSWASIISIVDQGRAQNGMGTLDGASQTLPMLYQLSQTDPSAFHKISGGTAGASTADGYNIVTGLGTPVVNKLVLGLDGTSASASHLAFTQTPATGIAGLTLNPAITVAIENQSGQVVTTDNSTVTLSIASGPGSFTSNSTITVNAVNGIATFSNVILSSAGSYTLSVSDSADMPTLSFNSSTIKMTAAATNLAVLQGLPTANGTAGVALSPGVQIGLYNPFGNLQTNDTSTVTLTIADGGHFSNGQTTVSARAVGGIATFSNLVFNQSGTYTLTATDAEASLVNGTANLGSININAAAASKLVFAQSLPQTITAGSSTGVFSVNVEDRYGNVLTGDNATTVTLSVGGVISSVTDNNGLATFSSETLTKAGNYRISASAPGLSSAGAQITVSPNVPTHLVYTAQPNASVVAGNTLWAVKVAVEDAYNNIVTTDANSINLAVNTLTGGPAAGDNALASSPMVSYANGVTTFSNLIFDSTGTYSLSVSDSVDLPTLSFTSSTIKVTPAPATKMVVINGLPTADGTAGVALGPAVQIALFDHYGNLVTNDTSTVTLTIVNAGNFSTGLSTVSARPVGGIATFSNLIFDRSGTYTLTATDTEASLVSGTAMLGSIKIDHAAPTKLVFSPSFPTTLTAGGSTGPIMVQVEDKFGNLVPEDSSTMLTLKVNGVAVSTMTDSSGLATFGSQTLTKSGNNTISVTSSPTLTTASATIAVSPGVPAQMVFTVQPAASVVAGNPLASVKVAVEDAYHNIVTTDGNPISLTVNSLTGGPTGGANALASSPTVSYANGVTTFSNLVFDSTGTYSLSVSDSADFPSSSFASSTIKVTPAAATSMVVLQGLPAAGGTAGVAIPAIQIALYDRFGNLATSDNSIVTLSISDGGEFSTNQTAVSVRAVGGIAMFSNLKFKLSGTYTLTATDTEAFLVNGTATLGSVNIN